MADGITNEGYRVYKRGSRTWEDIQYFKNMSTPHRGYDIMIEQRGPWASGSLTSDNEDYVVVGNDGFWGRFTTGDAALQAAIDDAGGLTIGIDGHLRMYNQVVVPEMYHVDTIGETYIQNHMTDGTTACLHFKKDTATRYLKVDANGGKGVRFGDSGEGMYIEGGYVQVTGAADDQNPVEVKGFDHQYGFIEVTDGLNGIHCTGADVFIGGILAVNTKTGLGLYTCDHVHIGNADVDSYRERGVVLHGSSDVTIANGTVWVNSDFGFLGRLHAISVGPFGDEVDSAYVNMNILGSEGTAVALDSVRDSYFDLNIMESNGEGFSYANGITDTASTASSVVVAGNMEPSITNAFSGVSNAVIEMDSYRNVASGTVTLSSGSAVVSTGVTTTPTLFDVFLDPSGDGANSADVKASARAFWDNSAGEYKIEILEDGTSVGNPDVGYEVRRK